MYSFLIRSTILSTLALESVIFCVFPYANSKLFLAASKTALYVSPSVSNPKICLNLEYLFFFALFSLASLLAIPSTDMSCSSRTSCADVSVSSTCILTSPSLVVAPISVLCSCDCLLPSIASFLAASSFANPTLAIKNSPIVTGSPPLAFLCAAGS